MPRSTSITTEARGMGPLPRLLLEEAGERRLLDLLRQAVHAPIARDALRHFREEDAYLGAGQCRDVRRSSQTI